MWVSLNEPCRGEPRWPLVPNETSWLGSSISGRRSKYSRSSRTGSISISLGAGLPASGEIVIRATPSGELCHRTWLCIPDFGCVLGDGAVARELAGGGDVEDGLARPR